MEKLPRYDIKIGGVMRGGGMVMIGEKTSVPCMVRNKDRGLTAGVIRYSRCYALLYTKHV